MSGVPPIGYTVTASGPAPNPDPTDPDPNDPAADPKYKLKSPGKKPATSYKARPIPPSRPAVTQSRGANLGYEQRLDFWRLIAVTKDYSDVVKFKAEAIRELQFSSFKPVNKYKPKHKNYATEQQRIEDCAKEPLSEQDIKNAIDTVHDLMIHGKDLKEIYAKLVTINLNLPDFIAQALKGQFSRGPGNTETALTSFSDLDPNAQWLDLMGKFEKREIVDVLQSALFYNNREMVVDDKGTATLYRQTKDPATGDVIQADPLTKSTVDNKNHKVNFSLEENSVEAVIALADQISTHRQGQNNTIKLTEMGDDPVLFALLVHILIRQHNMQVHMDQKLIDQVSTELTKSGNQALDKIWQEDVNNRLVYSKLSPRLLNAEIPRTKRISQIQHENPLRLDLFEQATPPAAPAPKAGAGMSASIGKRAPNI